MSYFAGPLEGSDSEAMEILIESVHRFSVYPIVVLHGGIATPLQLCLALVGDVFFFYDGVFLELSGFDLHLHGQE